MASTADQTALLEREDELGELAETLESSFESDGRALLLMGGAGIGKTSLLEAAAESGHKQGFDVRAVRADSLEVDLSFGLCAQLFGHLANEAPEEVEDLFTGAAANARPILGGAAVMPPTIGEDRIMSLIHGLYWLSANLAERKPLLLCIDDLHWADTPSLRFVHYLARRLEGLPIALVLAARPPKPGSDADRLLSAIAAEPGCASLEPDGLSAEAVSALVAEELGEADEDFSAACHRLSGGNPFYLQELVRSARENGLEQTSRDLEALSELRPKGVAESVMARLARLGDDAKRLAEVSAVGGGRLKLRDAIELARLDVEAGRVAADALADTKILDGGEPLTFSHPLVQDAVYNSVGEAERAGLHLRVADLMRQGGSPPKAVAVHLLSAERRAGDWVVDALEQAALEEIAQGSPVSAARLLRRALEEDPPEERRGQIMITLGLAETEAGLPEAAGRMSSAIDLLPAQEQRAGALLALGTTLSMQGNVTEATAAYERGLDEIAGVGGQVARDLEAMCSIGLDHDRGVRAEALPRLEALIAAPGIDETATGRALLAHAASERAYQGGSLDELKSLAERATAPGMNEDDPMAFWAYFFSAYAYNDSDDFERADAASAKARELAQARGSSVQAAAACHPRSFLNLRRGNIEAAVADAQTTVEGAEKGWRIGLPSGLSVLGEALLERGEVEAAAVACELPDGDEPWECLIAYLWLLDTRGRVQLAQGDAEGALATFLECGEGCEASAIRNPSVLAWRSGAAIAANRAGDADRAVELAEAELAIAREAGTPRAIGIAQRTAALVSGGDEAVEQIREALAVLEDSPARLEHASTLVELGAALRRAGHRRDSREPLREGLDMATRCGALAIAERAKTELAAAGARPRRLELTGVESLTPSERRISTMAAEGLSNPEIAQSLFLTRRTVEMHLTNAYRKLDISSRDQLEEALASHVD